MENRLKAITEELCSLRKQYHLNTNMSEEDNYYDKKETLEKEYKESQGSHPRNDMLVEVAKDYIGQQAVVSDGEDDNE